MQQSTKTVIIGLLLIFIPGMVFMQIRHHDHVSYDDPIVTENTAMKQEPLTINNLYQVVMSPPGNMPYKMPISVVIYMTEVSLFNNDYGNYHLVSLSIHLMTTLMLFLLLQQTTGAAGRSGFVAALFAVHPLNVEPVCWISATNDVMVGFFFVLSLVAYRYYLQKLSIQRYALVLFVFTCGLLCKPLIIPLPLILLLFDFWPAARFGNRTKDAPSSSATPATLSNRLYLKLLVEKIPFLVIIAAFMALRAYHPSAPVTGETAVVPTPTFRPAAIAYYIERLAKIFFPTNLSIRDTMVLWSYPTTIAAALLILTISIVVILFSKRKKYLFTGWFWYIGGLMPVIFLLAGSGRPMGDRFTYIPGIGIFLLIAWLGYDVTRQLKYRTILRYGAATVIIAIFSLLSFFQAQHWRDSVALYQHALTINPDNQRARANLGDFFLQANRIDKALYHYHQLLKVSPDSALAYNKMGDALSRNGQPEKAAACYRMAISLNPDYAVAHNNLANLLLETGSTDKAIYHYRRALAINPALFKVHNNMATALIKKGEAQEAVKHLRQALALNPDYQTARDNLLKIEALKTQ